MTGFMKRTMNRSYFVKKRILQGVAAAIVVIAAIFICWWKGLFIPQWVKWEKRTFPYGEAQLQLESRRVMLYQGKENGEGKNVFFTTNWDWSVQDVLSYDINHDGREELVMLVWKHGSYGKHLPVWVKHNDIRLEQHIFIYQWDETRDTRLRPMWMSSALGFQVSSIAKTPKNHLIITNQLGTSTLWQWQDFGLKRLGEKEEHRVSFVCAGDNLIHTRLLRYGEENGNCYDYLYESVKNKVNHADLASINQETIFVKDRGLISDFPLFGTPVEVGAAIVNAGFDIITLATNHVLDKGSYGIEATTSFYEQQKNVTYLGVYRMDDGLQMPEQGITMITKNGIQIALLNYTYGTNGQPIPKGSSFGVECFLNEERLLSQLKYARKYADAVIVFAHWGTEYSTEIDESQKYLTNIFLEQGVDVVVGTHPHVLQPFEMLERQDGHQMLVYYSLGNLVSGQDKPQCLEGGLGEFVLKKSIDGVVEIEEYGLEKIRCEIPKS